MHLEKKRVLVTGADGFIGSHLTEELVRRGCDVRAFVYYNSFDSWGWLDRSPDDIKSKLDVFAGDIRDGNAVKQAMKGCDVVFHLAALIGIPYSYVAPESYVDTNVKGSMNVLQAARELGTSKVVMTSTSEVYGSAKFVPIHEEHPIQAQSPYAATKAAADQLAMSYYQSFQTPVTIIRPFNTYGPRQSARAVIPTVITQIAAGKRKLKLGSVHTTRDFNFISDTVDGFIAGAESDAALGQTINIGSNFEVSIEKTVQIIAGIFGHEVSFESEADRIRPENSEVVRLWADNAKAKKLLNWSPKYAGVDGLTRGLEKTVKWFTSADQLNRYKTDKYTI